MIKSYESMKTGLAGYDKKKAELDESKMHLHSCPVQIRACVAYKVVEAVWGG